MADSPNPRYCFMERMLDGTIICNECELVWEEGEEFKCMREVVEDERQS